MTNTVPSRDDLASDYLDQLQHEPYPVQEEALLAWFASEQGVLVCAPTGTGKTLIAEAAVYEALRSGRKAYYTTPLIALTEQKFEELQAAVVRWGFDARDVGLVTGHRKVNPEARILVVVAEILMNRLLHPGAFDFADVMAVVMDEFHSFNDPERGIVWELSLTRMPSHVRLLLLSATVGNSHDFLSWLSRCHRRRLQLVQGTERKVPLRFDWVDDRLLNEQVEWMCAGDEETRRVPALLFCFNRNECWNVAEQLKGRGLISKEAQKELARELEKLDFGLGAGSKLKQILIRGVGVHHAGLMPRYRRIVESLFQRKLLSVCVCTETLAAGMNLPARSVVMTTLLKGPPQRRKLVDASNAHQIFGRAGRPQFDREGFVFAMAHEDDVRILRWREKYDQIPEDTRDPMLIRARKKMKKKMPTRRKTAQYWEESQFQKLRDAPAGRLASRGAIPWRLLAYLLRVSPEVIRLKSFLAKRLLDPAGIEVGQRQLVEMLITLDAAGFVELHPSPPSREADRMTQADNLDAGEDDQPEEVASPSTGSGTGLLGQLIAEARDQRPEKDPSEPRRIKHPRADQLPPPVYEPVTAQGTDRLEQLLAFRSVNPLYAMFLIDHFGRADRLERLQMLESLLPVPAAMMKQVRVPGPDQLAPGPLATGYLDEELLTRGLITPEELRPFDPEEDNRDRLPPVPLADRVRRLFDAEFPRVDGLYTRAVWIAADLLEFEGDFDRYVRGRDLVKQEGIVFRHVKRLILLCEEFAAIVPRGIEPDVWDAELDSLVEQLMTACHGVDPESTDELSRTIRATAESRQEFLEDEFGLGV